MRSMYKNVRVVPHSDEKSRGREEEVNIRSSQSDQLPEKPAAATLPVSRQLEEESHGAG